MMLHYLFLSGVCDEAPSVVARLLIIASIILVIVTLPFSLCLVIKVVQVLTPQFSSLYARDNPRNTRRLSSSDSGGS